MAVSKDEVIAITSEMVSMSRREIDKELIRLHEQDLANAWTEERAAMLAERAANLAVKKITDSFYLNIGKKTVATIGALVVGLVIFMNEELKKWIGLK
ncbi:hypothetical protein [Immundisolibacter sp.]